MNHSPEKQLRELIRHAIREELTHRTVNNDPKTGVTTSSLEDKGERVGYVKHMKSPKGGIDAVGRIGPKAAEKTVDETSQELRKNYARAAIRDIIRREKENSRLASMGSDTTMASMGQSTPNDQESDERAFAAYNANLDKIRKRERGIDNSVRESTDNEKSKTDDGTNTAPSKPKRPRKKKVKRSIEDIAREQGQIEMFPLSEWKFTANEWASILNEARLSPEDAEKILATHDANNDFHALSSDKVSALLSAAKDAKYRRRSNAPGSKGRMFHQHLTRLAGKIKEGDAVTTAAPSPDEEGEGQYNPDAVDKAIQASNRFGRRIGKSEAKKIHRLLKGWRGNTKNESLVIQLDKLRQTPTYKQILLGSQK